MAKTTVPGLYIADGAITAAKLSSTLDLSGVTITVATASTGDSDTSVASTAFVQQEIAALVDSSPSALNTLNELAAAIGDDASFSTTVTNSIATKLPLAGGTLTGNLIINTTGSIQIPVGTTAQRPTAAQGQLRFNTTTSKPEIYNGSAWADVGGGVESVNSATGVVVLTTANITENTNLYYTDARADARIAAADTDDLSEGSTNLYFTTARANSAFDGRLSGSTGVTVSNGAVSIGQDIATSTSPTFQNLTLSGTDSIKVPSGTTAQRSGSPANGMLRYNSSTNEFEGYADSAWGAIGGDTTSSVDLYTATGNGSTSTYDTGKNPQSENNTWVFIGGVYQPKSTYSFSGTQITLSENLPNGEDLEVITGTVSTYNPTDAILGQYNVTTSNTASYDTSLTTENENNVFVFVDGVYQPKSSYTYSGSTLTLDAVPTSGMSLEVLVTRSMNAATVTTGFLADDAVTTVKILDANVTAGKLASSLDLTGKTVTVATASAGDNDTSVASTAFVRQEITSLVDSAPAAMDTLNELAAALGDDANFSTTVNASIAAKLPLAGGTLTGNLNFGDSDKAIFGAGSDLSIYHDGSNSFIADVGTGVLDIQTNGTEIQMTKGGAELMAKLVPDGAVTLYYNNSPKLATTSTGIDVTGEVQGDTLDIDGTADISSTVSTGGILNVRQAGTGGATIRLGKDRAADGSSYIDLISDATNTYSLRLLRNGGVNGLSSLNHIGTGVLRIKTTDAADIVFDTNSSERMRIDSSGNVGIGNTVASSMFAGASQLVVGSGTGDQGITIYAGNSSISRLHFADGTSGNNQYAGFIAYAHNDDKFLIGTGATGGTDVTIDGGKLGIGVGSPAQKLHVSGGNVRIDTDANSTFTIGDGGTDAITLYGGTGDELYIGANNAYKLRFKTDGNIVMDNGGSLGIGTAGPTAKLHVFKGESGAVANNTDSTLVLENSSHTYINFLTPASKEAGILWGDDASANTGMITYSHVTDNMTITAADDIILMGKVGIGTSAPAHPLSVQAANAKITACSTADSQVIGFQARYLLDHATLYGSFEYHTGDAQLYIDNNFTGNNGVYGDINFRNKDNGGGSLVSRMKIKGSTGNVGIGTDSPSSKLQIMGGTSGVDQISLSSNLSDNTVKYAGLVMTMYTNNTAALIGAKAENGNTSLFYGSSGSDHRGVTKHIWYTNSNYNSTSGNTERMRIDSSGLVSINPINNSYNFKVFATDTDSFFGVREDANNSVILQVDRSDGYTGFLYNGHSMALSIGGALSKASGSFKIDHPLESKKDTHHLVHSFVEAPQADNIYRGVVVLENGSATINLDTEAGMTEGTFVLLNTNTSCFTSNESDWDAVKGSVSGNILTISCQNTSSTATVSWLVIGERHDQHMIDTNWTDENGKVIVEPLKEETE